jgi:O-antigen/teichoic acid export membrane protein
MADDGSLTTSSADGRVAGGVVRGPLAQLFANIGWLLAGRGVGAILSIVYLAIITQSLGPQKFGQFAIILSTVQAIYGIITFNTWQIIVRYGGPHVVAGRADALGGLVRLMLKFELIAAIIGFAIAMATLSFFAQRFDWSQNLLMQAIGFAAVHALSFRNSMTGLLRVHDRFRAATIGDSALPVVRFIGSAILLLIGAAHSLGAFLIVWACSEAANALAIWLLVPKADRAMIHSAPRASMRATLADYPGLLRFAVLTNISTTFAAVNQHIVTLAVGGFLGEAAAGFFRIGYQLGQALAKVAEALSKASYTEFSRLRAHGDAAALQRLLRQANRIALVMAAVVIGTLLLVGRPALLLISGPAYLPALPLLQLLGIAAALDILGSSYESALLSHDKAHWLLGARIAGTVMLIIAFAAMIGTYGATGAAGAVFAASLVTAGLFILLVRRIVRA